MAIATYTSGIQSKALVFPDATLVSDVSSRAARLILVQTDQVLFPKAANNLDAAIALEEKLKAIQSRAISDNTYLPRLSEVREFGIQRGAEYVVHRILVEYTRVCRQMNSEEKSFAPGTQFNFKGISAEGIEVTLGNYGLFFATLIAASANQGFKELLAGEGERLLGSQTGFMTNLPGTSITIETSDGKVLFVNRGPTAEWKNMYGLAAAGHHNPKTTLKDAQEIAYKGMAAKAIPLEQLSGYQLQTETGTGLEDVQEFSFKGIAYSTGSELPGTEKIEVISSVKHRKTAEEIARSIEEKAPHMWETRVLYAATQEQLVRVVAGTFDSAKEAANLDELVILGQKGLAPGKDLNSVSYWPPVHAAALLTQLPSYKEHLPQRWLK